MFLLCKNLDQGSDATPDTQLKKGDLTIARPTKDPSERRSNQVNIGLSSLELLRLKEQADAANTNVTAFMRAAALNKKITVIKSLAPDFITRNELRNIGGNMNQIAHALNTINGMKLPNAAEIQAALNDLSPVMEKMDRLFDLWLANDPTHRKIRP